MSSLLKKESQTVEFKSAFCEGVIETLVAFANTTGGKVLIGVANNGTPVKNFMIGEESIPQWLNEIKNKTQPSIIPNAEVIRYKNHDVVEFSVQEFPVKPISLRGRYFKRVRNSNHQLTPIEISDLSMQTLQVSWDSYPAQNATINDIDMAKVQGFINKVNGKGRFRLSGIPEDDLNKLRLMRDGKCSNAALLLFAKEETIYNVHLGRFKAPSMIIDDRMLRLPLFEAVEETMKYILSQIKVAFEIQGFPTQRTEIPEYPLDALRELVLNAIIHRDYLSSADIQIKIFDNYISFFNPGELHSNISIDDLKTNSYPAYARNKLIAEAFYLTGDIEKYGSGFLRVRDAIAQYPTMGMEFKEVGGGFMVTLSYTEQKKHTGGATMSVDAEKTVEKTGETVEKTVEKTGETVEKTVEKILDIIANNPRVTQAELAEMTGLTTRGVEWNISKLKTAGRIERIGADRGGHWKVRGTPPTL